MDNQQKHGTEVVDSYISGSELLKCLGGWEGEMLRQVLLEKSNQVDQAYDKVIWCIGIIFSFVLLFK